MYWRVTHSQFASHKAEDNRRQMRALVMAGKQPGLIGYAGDEPVAWVSLGPRPDFAALEASRLFRRVDDKPVWSVVCFVVRRDQRRQGWMGRLLRAAAEYAAEHGATLLEGYPVECGERRLSGDGGYTGIASTFVAQGFREVARPKRDRPVMRRRLRRRRSVR
jgi:GNAT superfamily N-acetyltransferase